MRSHALFFRKAFTLLELLFVIVIIGALVTVALPRARRTFVRLQLVNFAQYLQSQVYTLSQQSVISGKLMYLNFDLRRNAFWAQIEDSNSNLKKHTIPSSVSIETAVQKICLYPDGSIDTVTLKLSNTNGDSITMTTEGVLRGIKILGSV